MSRPILLLAASVLALGAAAAGAQPRPGDWIVGDTGQTVNGVLYLDPLQTSPAPLTTLVSGKPPVYYNWLRMHPDNQNLLAAQAFSGLLGVIPIPGGTFTSFASVPDSPNGMALDQDGTLLVSTSGGDQLLRVDLASKTTTVVATLPSVLNSVTVDRDTGEILVGVFDMNSLADGKVIRLSPAGVVLGTLAAGFGQTTAVDWDPVTGDFFVTSYDAPEVQRVNRKGVATTVARFKGANAVKVEEETGTLVVCGFDRTARMTVKGQILPGEDHTHPLTGGKFNWTSVEVYGASKLSGFGSAKPGTTYRLVLGFPASPGRNYAVLASLTGFRPGIRLNDNTGRFISLAPDPLFFSLVFNGDIPGVLENLRGLLDSNGRPAASQAPVVHLPPGVPKGTRVCFAAVAFNPLMASGMDISNPWSLLVQ